MVIHFDPHVPENQAVESRKQRKRRKWAAIADFIGKLGSYACVSLLTALVIYPELRFAFFVLSGNMLMIGIALGTALRWRAS